VKIVAVTASAFSEEEQEMREAGMDDYISKPYRLDEIYHCLEQQLGLKWAYATTESENEATMTTPTDEQLRELYQLADTGQIFEIQELLSRLQAENEAYIPFVQQLQKLARGFDIEGITTTIKQYL
jgi:CheY-like chemotaxis protein